MNTRKLVQCTKIQTPNQVFLRAGEVSWNQVTLINNLQHTTPTADSRIHLKMELE